MADIWTDAAVLVRWVEIESRVAAAQAELGIIPAAAAHSIATTPVPDISDVRVAERTRDHEVLSFLAVWTSAMPADVGCWVHYGLTSYDLVDTGLGLAMRDSMDLIIEAADRLQQALTRRALDQWDTLLVGRTHGVHAEPISFGHKLAGYAFALHRSLTRLRAARASIAVGTISGAVGTYSTTPPSVEARVLTSLGLDVEPAPTQVVPRDRHAEALGALAVLSATIEQLALELRLLQQTELAEVEESRTSAYQGSSIMPHKRNPTISERLCGLARLLRANVTAALEDIPLWHERDLVHSSVERVILPDSFNLAYYQAMIATELVTNLRIDEGRMRANLESSAGRIFSSRIYAHLLGNGVERERAYRVVQSAASESLSSGQSLADVLAKEGFSIDENLLDPRSFLCHEGIIRERLLDGWDQPPNDR